MNQISGGVENREIGEGKKEEEIKDSLEEAGEGGKILDLGRARIRRYRKKMVMRRDYYYTQCWFDG